MTKIHRSGRFEKSCLRWTSDGPDRAGSIRRTKLPSDLDRSRLATLSHKASDVSPVRSTFMRSGCLPPRDPPPGPERPCFTDRIENLDRAHSAIGCLVELSR